MGKRAPDMKLYDQAVQRDRDALGEPPDRIHSSFELLDQRALDSINGGHKAAPPTVRRTAPEAKRAEPLSPASRLQAMPKAPPPQAVDDFEEIIARPTFSGTGWHAFALPVPDAEAARGPSSKPAEQPLPATPPAHTDSNVTPRVERPAPVEPQLSPAAVVPGVATTAAAAEDIDVASVLADAPPLPRAREVDGAGVLPAPAPVAATAPADAAAPVPLTAEQHAGAATSQAGDVVIVDPPITADDVANVTPRKPEPVHGTNAAECEPEPIPPGYVPHKRRRHYQFAVLLVAALVIACALAAAMIRDLGRAAELTNPNLGAVVVPPVQRNVLSPDETTTVETPAGNIAIPGTGYIDATGEAPGAPADSIVPVWPSPFERGASPECALLHGGSVLVLDTQVNGAGSRVFNVQRRECTGWIDGQFLSPTAISPNEIPQPAATVGPANK